MKRDSFELDGRGARLDNVGTGLWSNATIHGKETMNLTTVEYEKRGQVAHVTLNRPDKLNAMNAVMHEELGRIWEDFRDDASLRVAILSGKGRCFSAGADLSERANIGPDRRISDETRRLRHH